MFNQGGSACTKHHNGWELKGVKEVPNSRKTYREFFGTVEVTRARFRRVYRCHCGAKTRNDESSFSKTVSRRILFGFRVRKLITRWKLGRLKKKKQ